MRNVNKRYDGGDSPVTIFTNTSLDLDRAGFYAIMGPSGSGKTTLLNIIGGVDRIDSGEFWFDGSRVDALGERAMTAWRAEHVAFVFQSFNLLGVLTAAQNVELPLLLTSLSAKERKARVSSALGLVGLDERAQHLPSELSGGQQQRVAIARAVVADTPLIVCDEPTGNLDRRTSDEVLDILRLLNTEFYKTIVMATHDPVAAGYARETLVLDGGSLEHHRV